MNQPHERNDLGQDLANSVTPDNVEINTQRWGWPPLEPDLEDRYCMGRPAMVSSWPGHTPSGCSGTRFLCLETQRYLTPVENPFMDPGINSPIPSSRNICFVTGSCCTGWDGSVIIATDCMTQVLSGGVLSTASLPSSV